MTTELTNSEKNLHSSGASVLKALELVAEILPTPVYWHDNTGVVLGINEQCLEAIGASRKIVGKRPYDFYPKGVAEHILEHNKEVMSTEKVLSQEERIEDITTKQVKYFSAIKAPLYDDNGKVIGIVGTSIDITAEKEAEYLRHENIRLEAENKLNQITLEKTALEANAARLKYENEIQRLENEKLINNAEQQAQFRKIAAQVAHDIASPIFALQMILPRCEVLPENTRSALSKFSNRIIDITQNFLSQFKQKPEDGITINGVTRTQACVYTELIEIVTEKKYEYSKYPIKLITQINPNSYFTFINIDIDAFKRMMSNLINNSIDAFDNKDGIITIFLDITLDKVQIIIEDNGKGIHKNVIDKIMTGIAITSGKLEGHGIGFSQIRDTLNNNEGIFNIDSELGYGTKITINFPKIETPNWITSKIELKHDDLVFIVDDEPYVHEAWECQFKSFAPDIIRQHFEQGREAISFINDLTKEDKKKVLLLTDYELLKQKLNGLDIINKTNVKRSILVTSHHNSQEIRDLAKLTNTKILPKELAFAVNISLSNEV
jgi:PAS domain S-box-containing protein